MGTQRGVGMVLAAALLLLLALPFAAMGVWLLNEVLVRGHAPGSSGAGGSGGVFEAMVASGVGLLLVAALHLAAAALTWRGSSRSLAHSIALAGVVLGAAAVGLSLFGARDVVALVLPFPLAYAAVLVCLRGAPLSWEREGKARPDRG